MVDDLGMQRTLRLLFVVTLVGSVLAASLGAIPRAWAADSAAEPQIKTPGPIGDYMRRVHARIHTQWAEGFLKPATVALPAPPASAAALAPREATIALTIRWDGTARVRSRGRGRPPQERSVPSTDLRCPL
jgi:hypothetical protein